MASTAAIAARPDQGPLDWRDSPVSITPLVEPATVHRQSPNDGANPHL